MIRGNLPCFNLCPLPLSLPLDTTEKSHIPNSLHFPFRYLYILMRSLPRVLSSRLNSPSSLSLSLELRRFSPLIILVALCWTFSGMAMSVLYWEAQNWTQDSRCGIISVEWRGSITSLDLLAILCLRQLRISYSFFATRTHWWLMVNLAFSRIPRSFSVKLLSSWSAPSRYWCLGLFLPMCRMLHFPLLNCMRFQSAHFSSLLRSLWMAAQPSGVLGNPPIFVSSVYIVRWGRTLPHQHLQITVISTQLASIQQRI